MFFDILKSISLDYCYIFEAENQLYELRKKIGNERYFITVNVAIREVFGETEEQKTIAGADVGNIAAIRIMFFYA